MPQTNDGAKLYIMTAPETFDQTAWEAAETADAVEIGEIVDIGEIGSEYASVASYVLGRRAIKYYKGSKDWGETTFTLENERTDAGQVQVKDYHDGANEDADAGFVLTRQDGTKFYFTSKVFRFKDQSIAQDSMWRAACALRVNDGTELEVLPTP